MKKYYNIVFAIGILAILSVIAVIYQFQSNDDTLNEHTIYEMNDNWRLIATTSVNEVFWEDEIILDENTDMSFYDGEPDDQIYDTIRIWDEDETGTAVSLPYSGTSKADEMVVFQNTISQDCAGLTLAFYSTESAVSVILDGEMIYRYGVEGQEMSGRQPKSRLNFVNIPDEVGAGDLSIALVSSSDNAAATLSRVSISQRDALILRLIEYNLANLFSSLLMLLCAVIFLITGIVCLCIRQNTYNVFWLVALSANVGLYYLFKAEMLSIFSGTIAVYYIGQYLLIMLTPLLLLMYQEKDLKRNYPRLYAVLFTVVNLNIFIQIILYLTGTADLADMLKYTAGLFRTFLTVCILLYVATAVKKKAKRSWFMAAVCAVLLTGELLTLYAQNPVDGQGNFSLYAMTVFLLALAVYHVVQMSLDYKAKAEESARLALAASEAKGKFLANMSHEIRTPLNAILGMDEMILRESAEPKIREYAMDIFTSGQMLLSLINDILDLSKIESGKMEIIPTNYDVSSMIHDLSTMTELRAKQKNLRLHVEADREIPCVLRGDDVRLRQVLTNILTNAVKYTHEGDIWFRIRREQQTDEAVTLYFEIEDTGIGIKEEDLPKLYMEFERIEESRNRNIEGTGLGMSITLQLLYMMGSRLQVESVYGKGSKFYFSIEQKIIDRKPIGDFEQNVRKLAEEYTYTAGFTAPEAEILVVDDNAINRRVFGNLLNQTQVNVSEADSGFRCLTLTKQKRFDIIFLDHMMPEMDGVETLNRLKADPENLCRDTPVIALTANAVSGAKEWYLEIGFSAYLSKPIVSEKLEKILWAYLPDNLINKSGPEVNAQLGTAAQKLDMEQLPAVDGLDWNYAWLHLAGMDLLESTTKAFYEQIPAAAEKLDACYREILESGQFDAYRIQIHALKSLAATLGILSLAGMAKVLENAAKSEQPEIIHSMHKIFLMEWNGYREKLVGVFGIEAAEDKEEMEDSSIICALLEMVNIAMHDMNIDEADEKMKIICSYRYADEVQKNIELLKAAVENLDPEQTETLVQTIINQLSKY